MIFLFTKVDAQVHTNCLRTPYGLDCQSRDYSLPKPQVNQPSYDGNDSFRDAQRNTDRQWRDFDRNVGGASNRVMSSIDARLEDELRKYPPNKRETMRRFHLMSPEQHNKYSEFITIKYGKRKAIDEKCGTKNYQNLMDSPNTIPITNRLKGYAENNIENQRQLSLAVFQRYKELKGYSDKQACSLMISKLR